MEYLGRKESQHLQPWLWCSHGFGNKKMGKGFWEFSESIWVLSIQINWVRGSHQPLLYPGSFSISQWQIRVWPSASSARLFQLHQYKVARGHLPWGSSHGDKQRCPEGSWVREIPRELWAREVPEDEPRREGPCLNTWDNIAPRGWTQKRKDHI